MTDAIKNNARAIASKYNRTVRFIDNFIQIGSDRNYIDINTTTWFVGIMQQDYMNWDEHTAFAQTLECARCIVGVMNIGK